MSTDNLTEADRIRQELSRRLLARRATVADTGPRRMPAEEAVAASYAQQRLWFLDELAGQSAVYNVPFVLRLTGELSVPALTAALQAVLDRHEALRTRFVRDPDGTLVQRVAPADRLELPVLAVEPAEVGEQVERFASRPFSLTRDPMLRALLLRLSDTEHLLLLSIHHIVSDGWSEQMLFDELAVGYEAGLRGEPPALPEVPFQYRDYTAWEYRAASGGGFERDLRFWQDKLAGAPAVLELPHSRPRPRQPSGAGRTLRYPIADDLAAALERLGQSLQASAFTVALAALGVLLHRLTGSDDIVLGVPVANRPLVEWERTYGLFVNTVAVRLRPRAGQSLRDCVADAQQETLAAQDHQHTPFDLVANRVGAGRDRAFTPVFQVMCNLVAATRMPQLAGLRCELVETETETSKFDLTLHLVEEDGRLAQLWAEFATDVLSDAEADRIARAYRRVLAALVADPDRTVAELPVADPAELRPVRPEAEQDRGTALVTASLRNAERDPGGEAVRLPGGPTLSWSELAGRSAVAARALRRAGVGAGDTVALRLPEPLEQVCWTWAVLRAGGRVLETQPSWKAGFERRVRVAAGPVLTVTGQNAAELTAAAAGPDDDLPPEPAPSAPAFLTADADGALLAHSHRGVLAGGPAAAELFGLARWLVPLARGERADLAGDAPAEPFEDGDQVLVLDRHRQRVPVGVLGEVRLRGAAVPLGWPDPRRTAERLRPDPFGTAGSRLFDTGRLGRVGADGLVQLLGSVGRAYRLAGVRVLPEQAEAVLRAQPGVADAAVVRSRDGAATVGFYTGEAPVDERALGQALAEHLLPQQQPTSLRWLEELPGTPDGGVDLERLAELADPSPAAEDERWTPTERLLAGLWSQVFEQPPAGRHEHFFAAGGHSLLAIRLVTRLREQWGEEVSLRWLFDYPVLSELARALDESATEATATAGRAVRPRPAGTRVPLSLNQEHLWFLSQRYAGSDLYTVVTALELTGELDPVAWQQALTEVVRRHEALRTSFAADDAGTVQVVADEPELDHRLVERPAPGQPWADAAEPFDLRRGPLLRSRLYRLACDRHLFVLAVHHIVYDEWSSAILHRELGEAYRAIRAGRRSQLPPVPVHYPDYACWQRANEQSLTEAQLEYWTGYLAGAPTFLDLPTDRPRPASRTLAADSRTRLIPAALLDRLRLLGAERSTTLYQVLLAGFTVLMHRYSGQADLLVGTTAANRGRTELEGQIGYFVNTVPVRSRLRPGLGFDALLAEVRQSTLDSQPHRGLPFARLVERLAPERSTSHSPLVQVMFDMQEDDRVPRFDGLTSRRAAVPVTTIDFDLVLAVRAGEDGLQAELEFDTDLFDGDTAERLLGHFENVLGEICRDPGRPVAELEIVDEAERGALLAVSAGPSRPADGPTLVHRLFEAQAAATPDAIALTHRELQLTYRQLDADAEALARLLRADGVGPDSRVGLYLDRGPALFVSVLAVLKAGGCYVPLDVGYPVDRLEYMLAEAGVQLVLADPGSAPGAAGLVAGRRLRVVEPGAAAEDRQAADRAAGESSRADRAADEARPESLAYILYTSGSTGRPKGVGLSHSALLNLMRWDREEIPVRLDGAVLQFNSLGFDASFVEMFAAWQVGARLVVLPTDDARRDPAVVLRHLETGAVERWDTPYVGLLNVVRWTAAAGRAPLLRLAAVMSGGEQLVVTDELLDWFRQVPGCRLVNQYGPSEVSRATSQQLGTAAGRWPVLPPIGRPADNTTVYVLDAAGRLAPFGVPGEVHIGGANLARGYVNRPALTAQRFLPDPFGPPGSRLYRTGDIARYRPDGALEYLGRVDDQLKLRGHRVEPGEVEAALRDLPGVEDAAVAVTGAGTSRALVGYLVAAAGTEPDPAELRRQLSRTLPDYMVPAEFVTLPRLPVTPSGKLDRKLLPVPERVARQPDYREPGTEQERRLAGIWGALLGRERVGMDDNFFELGGHSLLATSVVARVRSELGAAVSIADLLEHPTVAGLSRLVAARAPLGEQAPKIRALPRRAAR